MRSGSNLSKTNPGRLVVRELPESNPVPPRSATRSADNSAFTTRQGFATRTLAHVLDSLVRVSRRVDQRRYENERHVNVPHLGGMASIASLLGLNAIERQTQHVRQIEFLDTHHVDPPR